MEDETQTRRPLLAPYDVSSPIPLEIERKYLLLEDPDLSCPELAAAGRLELTTTFLARKGQWKGRVRCVQDLDGERFFSTKKRRLYGIVQEEDEREISRAEYEAALVKADPTRMIVEKTRFTFEHEGRRWELDVYRSPEASPRLEVELADADEMPRPPSFLGPLVEVSLEPGFSDRKLAKDGGARARARRAELGAAPPEPGLGI